MLVTEIPRPSASRLFRRVDPDAAATAAAAAALISPARSPLIAAVVAR